MKFEDLGDIQKKYQDLWKQIKAKYPKAPGYPNFAFKGEFVPITASLKEILKFNHHVFLQSEQMATVLKALKSSKDMEEKSVLKLLKSAPLNPECRIEIIWSELDYDLIKQLQSDPLVDLTLTPRTAASIRIVLGLIGNPAVK